MNLESLLKTQQGEIDAVLGYQKIAECTDNPKIRQLLLQVAADEGRHGAIYRSITGQTFESNPEIAAQWIAGVKAHGLTAMIAMFQKGEAAASESIRKNAEECPKLKQIIEDEYRHAEIMGQILELLK